MDIHKPKPWHGIREFLKEYAIIVVGVLTALGAEAVVANLHEARLSAEARDAVRAELNTNVTLVGRRLNSEPCIARRLDEIAALLDRAEQGEAFAVPVLVAGPGNQRIATQRWDAATAGGRTTLLTSDEQADFARVYINLHYVTVLELEEIQTWAHLNALNGARHPSSGMIDAERLALSEARMEDRDFRQAVAQAKFYAQRIGVKGDASLVLMPSQAPRDGPAICRPLSSAAP
jgi:hypothetical protein